MNDGKVKPLREIKVDDSLLMGSQVLGIVKINPENLDIYKYKIKTKYENQNINNNENYYEFIGSKNCIYLDGYKKRTTMCDELEIDDNQQNNNNSNSNNNNNNNNLEYENHTMKFKTIISRTKIGEKNKSNAYYHILVDDGMFMTVDKNGRSIVMCDYNHGLDYFLGF
jgi:hypothetical protein